MSETYIAFGDPIEGHPPDGLWVAAAREAWRAIQARREFTFIEARRVAFVGAPPRPCRRLREQCGADPESGRHLLSRAACTVVSRQSRAEVWALLESPAQPIWEAVRTSCVARMRRTSIGVFCSSSSAEEIATEIFELPLDPVKAVLRFANIGSPSERRLRPCLARRDASSAQPASALVVIETGAARSASFSEFGPISAPSGRARACCA